MNQILGFVLSLMGLVKTNYSPYAYHVYHYNKAPQNYIFSKTFTIDSYLPSYNPFNAADYNWYKYDD